MLLAILAGVLAFPVVLFLRPARFLATQWQDELKTLPDEQLPLRLNQLAGLGEEGLVVVVKALDEPRATLAAAASRILDQQLDRWQTLRLGESSQRVAALARVLAENSLVSGAEARQASAGLATRILLWPVDRTRVDGAQLVADCESVLRIARADRSTQANPTQATPTQSTPTQSTPTRATPTRATPTQATSEDVAATPRRDYDAGLSRIETATATLLGGDLPIAIADATSLPRLTTEQGPVLSPRKPRLFVPRTPAALRTVPTVSQPKATPATSDQTSAEQNATDSAQQSRADLEERGSLISVPAAAPPLTALTDLEVMRALQHADGVRTIAAGHELARRGFRAVHVDLARKLFDPDPRERAKLIDALPRIAGIDARPWLIVLSRDEEPAVRRQVIGLFATSGDPALLKQLQEIERVESDPEIRQLVRRILDSDRR